MNIPCSRLTVFFEDPFWVGVLERFENGRLSVCKVTFGAEPRDAEVYEWVLRSYDRLRFSPPVAAQRKEDARSPKRIQRQAARAVHGSGVGTKSQQALKLQQEQNKQQRRIRTRQQRQEEAQRRFEQKQQKKRERRKGH